MGRELNDTDIVWLICECYVWPTYWYSMELKTGSCGRCGHLPKLLNPDKVQDRQEAHEAYKTINGRYPEPIK